VLPMHEAVKVCCDAADASMRSRLLQHCRPTQMSLARWALLSVIATCSEQSCLRYAKMPELRFTVSCRHVSVHMCNQAPATCPTPLVALTCAQCAVQYRAWQQSGHFFIQMDLAEHGSLGHLLRQVCLRPSSFNRATEASATRCQPCSSTRSSRKDCSCCICMPFIRNAHVQVQEEGLLLPDALVWQVLWEVAQVRPIKDQEYLHLFQPTQG
jgi:hypothetical protein